MNTNFGDVQEDIVRLKQEFTAFKKSAKSFDDIKAWFKNHPYLIPKLASDHYRQVSIYITDNHTNYDLVNKTLFLECRFEFFITNIAGTEQKQALKEVTGFNFSKDLNTDTFFLTAYTDSLNALEWRFVAVDALAQMEEDELASSQRVAMYRNLLETHYPTLPWDTYLSLWHAGLLPDTQQELSEFLDAHVNGVSHAPIPQDYKL